MVQHLLPHLHTRVAVHHADPHRLFLPHQHLESSQLVLLVLLLHSNRQHRSLFGLQLELILVLPRKDVLQVGDLCPFSNDSQLLQLLVAEHDGVEEGNVGLAGQLDLEALRVEEKTHHYQVVEGLRLRFQQ